MSSGVSPTGRHSFITERRRAAVRRFDVLHSPHYGENWGATSPSHAAFVTRLAALTRPGGDVLDPRHRQVLAGAAGRGLAGHRGGPVRWHARPGPAQAPAGPRPGLALQDLARAGALRGRFDGLACVDALENIAPEDWPAVAADLAATLKPRAPAWVTVEVHDGPLPAPADPRQVPGEYFEGGEQGGYHYYPARDQARDWLTAAGFGVQDEQDADFYWHFLLERR